MDHDRAQAANVQDGKGASDTSMVSCVFDIERGDQSSVFHEAQRRDL